jgi:hypothetical protein
MNVQAINAELAKIGYKAVKIEPLAPTPRGSRKTRRKPSSVSEWKPQTQAGRSCKARMKMYASLPPVVGVTSYKVRGKNGKLYAEGDKGFAWAVAYQKRKTAWHANGRQRNAMARHKSN